MDRYEELSTDPLSPKELQQIRRVLEKEARWKWLAVTMRNTAAYVAVIVGGIILAWDTFTRIVRGVVK